MDGVFCTMNTLFDFKRIEAELSSTDDPAMRVAERNRLTDKLFLDDIDRAGWVLLRPSEHMKLPTRGRAIVLGTVLWSTIDHELLKEAATLLAGNENVFLVNLDEVHSAAELDAVMPGVPPQTDTPVVAEYQDGTLRRVAAGRSARTLLAPAK